MTLPSWPIVGRRPELEVFDRALGSGERAGLAIYGRAGVGKTRLADECAAQAAASGHPTERVAGSRTTALLPLGAVVALLPEGQRQSLVLRFSEGLRYEEIAEVLECPLGTVKSRIFHGLAALRRILDSEGEEARQLPAFPSEDISHAV